MLFCVWIKLKRWALNWSACVWPNGHWREFGHWRALVSTDRLRIRSESALLCPWGGFGREFLSKHSARGFVFIAPCCYWYHYAGLSSWEEGLRTGGWELVETKALMRSDTGSRSTEHPPEFFGSRTFPVSALDQRSLPANQNTWAWGSARLMATGSELLDPQRTITLVHFTHKCQTTLSEIFVGL